MNSIFLRLSLSLSLLLAVSFGLQAQCDSNAGSMSSAQVEACGDEHMVVNSTTSEFLEPDDILQYILHTDAGTSVGTVLSTSSTPEFDFPFSNGSMGVVYYISAIVGNDDGSGNVDLTDPCLSVAAGTPVLWIPPFEAIIAGGGGLFCPGMTSSFTVIITGQGPWELGYAINGAPQAPIFVNASPFTFDLPIFGQTVICLTSVTNVTTGCTGIPNGCVTFAPTAPVVCSANITPVECNGGNTGVIDINCTGGLPPFEYFWSTGQFGSTTIGNLAIGTYWVTIVDASGCSSVNSFNVTQEAPPFCAINVSGSINCQNPEATLIVTCTGGGLPFTYQWTGPNGFTTTMINPVITEPGAYTLVATSIFGCTYSETINVVGGNTECGSIIGTVTSEEDGNCGLDAGEPGLANWMVKATATNGDEYFDFTDADGNYSMQAPAGDYVVESLPPAAYWLNCGSTISLNLEDASDVDTADFHWLKTITCPLLEVDISAPLLRRCFDNHYYVNYCNNGSETASDATIEVTLDPLISILNSSVPYLGPVNGVYTFSIGDVAEGDCGSFYFSVHVSCNAMLGQTLCAEAHIFPDSLCTPVDPNWSGAQLEITSDCTVDSVIFTITNIGTGDMTEPQNLIVVEDGVMLMTNDVQLGVGESITVSFPANGSTYHILANQVDGVPGFSNLSIFVEGCGTNNAGSFSTGFASQLPEDDDGPFVSIDCQEVIGSYDPNDKRGYPLGYGGQNLIERGQALDYHIRFQNTGTDTAFLVKIQDVIDPSLDIATLRPGASSHPYTLQIHKDTLVFIFENILLPDSNVNEPGSHGFVKFRIEQKQNLPLGTVINNEAAIFFDFNDPVLTNQTRHELDEHFIINGVRKPVLSQAIQCNVYPNPFSDETVIVLQGAENQEVELRLYDLTGRFLRSEIIKNGMGKINRNSLSTGLYFYELNLGGMRIGQGKLAVE